MTISKDVTFRRLLLAANIVTSPLALMVPTAASAQVAVGISIQTAPPLLPIYVQPAMPEVGYVWTPGYWAYGPVGYYWIPGTWIQPPVVGLLWTPPYWGWVAGAYLFHDGYWGPHVGFYGGVNYGYGYGGSGYNGGHWDGGNFFYNRSANNFGSVPVRNAYEQTVSGTNRTNVSYVGGPNGLRVEPTAGERVAESETHTTATAEQARHITAAASNPAFAASHNNGHPEIAATSRPAAFEGAGGLHAQPAIAAERGATPAVAAHPAERAAGPAAAAHPAEHAARPAAAAHPAQHAAAARPAATRPAAHAAPQPAVAHAAQRPVAHAPAAHPAAARGAPAREEQHAEKR